MHLLDSMTPETSAVMLSSSKTATLKKAVILEADLKPNLNT